MRLPASVAARAEEVIRLTDGFSAEHLDEEYAALCRKLIGKLGRKRPSPLLRDDLRIWAAAVIHDVGNVNFLFDPTQKPHLSADSISRLTGVPKSTLRAKAKLICDLLGIRPMEPELCRRELLPQNPLAWLIEVDGLIVESRTMPPEIQEEARRRGLIPDLA
ncbi:MAG: hypothetical protein HY271_07675 [Deltaproteobacteria bacterium]|nr:hypothetical protein [Deltaproteobacteria bacterium]